MKNNLKFYLMSALCCVALVNTQGHSMDLYKTYLDFSGGEDKCERNGNEKMKQISIGDIIDNIHEKTLKNNTVENNQKKPIGLQNIGATCYMNSTLQAFAHFNPKGFVVPLLKEVARKKTEFKKADVQAQHLLEFANIMAITNTLDQSSLGQASYAPYKYKEALSAANPLFEGIAANDAKDLVNYIIMSSHILLNNAPANSGNQNNPNIILDQSDKQNMFNIFMREQYSKNQSVMSDNFYGITCNITQCNFCKNTIYNDQIYFFLVFPLEEVRKYVFNRASKPYNNNMMNNMNMMQPLNNQFYQNIMNMNLNNNMQYLNNQQQQFYLSQNYQGQNMQNQMNYNNILLTLNDCFEYDRKWNCMTGDNSMFCNFCKTNTSCMICTNLVTLPKTLIILFNRGKGIEFDVKIKLDEKINLSEYVENKKAKERYLSAVVCHIGKSSMDGHFVCYARESVNSKWYKYNDALIDAVDSNEISKVLNGQQFRQYLAFYTEVPDKVDDKIDIFSHNVANCISKVQHNLETLNLKGLIKNYDSEGLDTINISDPNLIECIDGMENIVDYMNNLLKDTVKFHSEYDISQNAATVARIKNAWNKVRTKLQDMNLNDHEQKLIEKTNNIIDIIDNALPILNKKRQQTNNNHGNQILNNNIKPINSINDGMNQINQINQINDNMNNINIINEDNNENNNNKNNNVLNDNEILTITEEQKKNRIPEDVSPGLNAWLSDVLNKIDNTVRINNRMDDKKFGCLCKNIATFKQSKFQSLINQLKNAGDSYYAVKAVKELLTNVVNDAIRFRHYCSDYDDKTNKIYVNKFQKIWQSYLQGLNQLQLYDNTQQRTAVGILVLQAQYIMIRTQIQPKDKELII